MSGCNNNARFDSEEQAQYVAEHLPADVGGTWVVVAHRTHWHVIESDTEGDKP